MVVEAAIERELLLRLRAPSLPQEEAPERVARLGELRAEPYGLPVRRTGFGEPADGLVGAPHIEVRGRLPWLHPRGLLQVTQRWVALADGKQQPPQVLTEGGGVRVLAHRRLQGFPGGV